MLRTTWMAIPALAVGVLVALPAGAQDTRGEQMSLDDLLQADGMTQEQMAVYLLRALGEGEPAPAACVPGQERFDDVPASSPFCPFIEELARRGLTDGCGGNNFCPGATATRAQVATFIVKTQDALPGLLGPGEPCMTGAECASGACGGAGPVCLGSNGDPCAMDPDCASGFCNASSICAPGGVGAPCSPTASCQGGLFCSVGDCGLPDDAGTCQLRRPDGECCTFDEECISEDCTGGGICGPPEPLECSDGFDNDGDGFIDADDPECTGPQDDDESA